MKKPYRIILSNLTCDPSFEESICLAFDIYLVAIELWLLRNDARVTLQRTFEEQNHG